MIWQPEFTDKTLSRKPGAVQMALFAPRRFFLAQTGELNIFNKQQANHRNTQHPYRQPEQRMVAPDFGNGANLLI